MHFTTERLERLRRSLELALNQEWPQLSATEMCLAKLRPTPIPILPASAKKMAVVATVATDGGENKLSLEPIQLQVIVVDVSGVVVTTLVAAAAIFLIPWRKLTAVVASTLIVPVVSFLMGLGAFTGYALSTTFSDTSNFIRHSGANRSVVFLVSGTVFIWMVWTLVIRAQVASTFMRAFYGEGEQANRSLGYARATALVFERADGSNLSHSSISGRTLG